MIWQENLYTETQRKCFIKLKNRRCCF